MLRFSRLNLILIGMLITPLVSADDTIVGYVKTTTPKAFLVHNNTTETAQVGSPIYAGTMIKTEDEGTLGLSLKDDTLLSFGPDTEFEISEYAFNPAENQFKLSMKILKGTLEYISGVIAKLKPDSISVKTPTSIIGVRGTRFVVKIDD
jgi:hypothetical protein